MMKTNRTFPLLLLFAVILSACVSTERDAANSPEPATATFVAPEIPTFSQPAFDNGITAISQGENRYLPVQANLANATPIDIPLSGKPAWIAGVPFENGSAWVVALEDGHLQAFLVILDVYTQTAISPERISPGMPLVVYSQNGDLFALPAPGADASPLSPPVLLDPLLPKIAYIATNGDLVIWQNGQETRLPVNALPDTRILADENGRLLLLSNPTERYGHGVLGDGLEAAGITLVETKPEARVAVTISIPEPDVIEGISPLWEDLNGDGQREIIITLSNAQAGARIVAFREDGSLLAKGPAIGTGFRWRHQLLVAPFGETGENLLAVVCTPHIGGVLELYRMNDNQLEIAAEIPGISTHSIGSRNLFTALAGDFDADGQVELLAPDQTHTRLGIVDLNGEIVWLDLNSELATNLSAAILPDTDRVVIAAGLANHSLRLWLP